MAPAMVERAGAPLDRLSWQTAQRFFAKTLPPLSASPVPRRTAPRPGIPPTRALTVADRTELGSARNGMVPHGGRKIGQAVSSGDGLPGPAFLCGHSAQPFAANSSWPASAGGSGNRRPGWASRGASQIRQQIASSCADSRGYAMALLSSATRISRE